MAEPHWPGAVLLCCALALAAGTVSAEPENRQQRQHDAGPTWLARNDDSNPHREGGNDHKDRDEQRVRNEQPARDDNRGPENHNGRYYRERPDRRESEVGQAVRIERHESDAGQQPRNGRPEIGIPPPQRAQHGQAGQPVQPRRWEDFSPEERQRLQRREQGFRALPDEQQQRLRQTEQLYRSMPSERREELRRRWEGMSESERERYRRRVENQGN